MYRSTFKSGLMILLLGLFATKLFAASGKDKDITAGSGYSSDMQLLAPQTCFNTTAQFPQSGDNTAALYNPIKFFDLEKALSGHVESGVGLYNFDPEYTYLHDILDQDYSLSLNYYAISSGKVVVTPRGTGMNALNATGQNQYQTNFTNFGVTCGDNYVDSYQEGAMLAMTINLRFNSNYDKTQFLSYAGGGIFPALGNISNAMRQIQAITIEHPELVKSGTSGTGVPTVILEVYQAGGDPDQLLNVPLNKESNGYYTTRCDLSNMQTCLAAADKLLVYVTSKTSGQTPQPFLTQYSYTPARNLEPLSTDFIHYTPIAQLGLMTPPTLVNSQVDSYRVFFDGKLVENQYYTQKLYSMLNGYPIPFEEDSYFYANSIDLQQDIDKNINLIMNPSAPELGGLACYADLIETDQNSCLNISPSLFKNIYDFPQDEFSYIQQIEYIYPIPDPLDYTHGVTLYYTGTEFQALNNMSHGGTFDLQSFPPNDYRFIFEMRYVTPYVVYSYSGTSPDGGKTYVGQLCETDPPEPCNQVVYGARLDPFYFPPYHSIPPVK